MLLSIPNFNILITFFFRVFRLTTNDENYSMMGKMFTGYNIVDYKHKYINAQCAMECLRHVECKSFNFGESSGRFVRQFFKCIFTLLIIIIISITKILLMVITLIMFIFQCRISAKNSVGIVINTLVCRSIRQWS